MGLLTSALDFVAHSPQLAPLLGLLCLILDRLAALRNVLACARHRAAADEHCGTSNQHPCNQSNHYLPLVQIRIGPD